jgi:putative peptidoglycan lipid II flippase
MASQGSGRHALLVAAGILLTRVLGFIRERVFAHYLGSSAAADAFRAALRIPNVLRNLLGEGALSASFIPVYASLTTRDDPRAARALAGSVAGILLAASGAASLIGIALAPAITQAVAPGFDEQTTRLTVALVRILFPMSGLMILSAWCLGILNSHRRFFLPYAAPAVWNIAGIAALVGAAQWLVGPDLPVEDRLHALATALAWGTLAGSALQLIIQLPTCWRLLQGLPVSLKANVEGVGNVLRAWGPLVIGTGVAQISGLVDTLLGSLLGQGSVANLGYAQLLQTLPISLFGVSVAAVALPDLSRDAAGAAPAAQLQARLAAGFRTITFYVIAASVAYIALGREIVAALFQTGRFGTAEAAAVGGILAAYGIGITGHATAKLFASGYYALRDTRTPVAIAVLSLAISTAAAILLMRRMGAAGIALGASIGAFVNLVLQVRGLTPRVGRILGRAEWGAVLKAILAAGMAGLAARGVATLLAGAHPLTVGGAALVMFGAAYLAATYAFGHPDARRLTRFANRGA